MPGGGKAPGGKGGRAEKKVTFGVNQQSYHNSRGNAPGGPPKPIGGNAGGGAPKW